MEAEVETIQAPQRRPFWIASPSARNDSLLDSTMTLLGVCLCGMGLSVLVPWITSSAHADDLSEKRCIYQAAQELPSIPGLLIQDSRTRPIPDDVRKKLTGGEQQAIDDAETAMIVDIDVKAAAHDATFRFICAVAGAKIIAEPIGIVR
ncbi:MAG: hypothetical protein WBQ75_08450 [Acetobacteraceae bacterium]